MKNTAFYFTLCILLGLSNMISAQDAGNYLYNNPYQVPEKLRVALNTPAGSNISLKAEVMMNVKATSYTAIFAMTQTGRDAYEVDSLLQGRLAQVRFALALLGIADTDIHVDAISMVPTYAYKIEEKKFSKRSVEVPTGLEMKKNIHVLFRNHDVLDRIISEMAFVDVYDLVKVEYNILFRRIAQSSAECNRYQEIYIQFIAIAPRYLFDGRRISMRLSHGTI
jgi:uncharacterized protein YggE